jgi:hypothetical protein
VILHRLVTELRNQNWITVVLELVVVVAGIFLGLQADAWNEARNDRIRERAHLEQIYADAVFNAEQLAQIAEHHAELADGLIFAIGVVKRGEIRPDEVERFKWAILTMLQYPPAAINTGGYDTLIASGDFSVLRDSELRSRLVRMHSYFEAISQRIVALTGGQQRELPFSSNVAYAIPHPSGKGILWQVDYELLRDDRGTLANLASERRNHAIVQDIYAEGARESGDLKEYIDRLVGKEKAPMSE